MINFKQKWNFGINFKFKVLEKVFLIKGIIIKIQIKYVKDLFLLFNEKKKGCHKYWTLKNNYTMTKAKIKII